MSRYMIRADSVLTMNAKSTIVRNAAVIVNGGRIEAVGAAENLSQRGPFEQELGGAGFILLPGHTSGHTHTAVVLQRAFASMAFERREPVTMYMAPWTEEELYWLNLYLNLQLLKAGTTGTVSIFYGLEALPDLGCEPLIKAFLDSGIRGAVGIAARDRWDLVHVREPSEFLGRLPDELAKRVESSPFGYPYDTAQIEDITRRMAAKYQDKEGRFRMFACVDFTPAATDELYGRMKALAKELTTGIVVHLLETPYEMLHSFRTYGKSAIRRLADLGFLGPEVTATDCVWSTADDLPILADTGVTAVYTPWHISGFSGIAPVREMMAAGVNLAFSIMLRSQNDGYDVWSDMAIGEHLQHIPGIKAEALPADQFLKLGTAKAGRTWALDDSLGTIEAGKRADLVLMKSDHLYDDAFLDPNCDLHRVVLYRGRADDVDTVIVEGKVVVEGGQCLMADESEAFDRARAGALRISSDTGGIQKWLDLAAELDPYVLDYYTEWRLPEAVVPWNAYNARSFVDLESS